MSKDDAFDISSFQFVNKPPPSETMGKSKYSPLYKLFEEMVAKKQYDDWGRIEIKDSKEGAALTDRLYEYATVHRKPVETAVRIVDDKVYFYFRPKRKW